MSLSLFVYLSLMIAMTVLCGVSVSYGFKAPITIFTFIAIMLFSFIFGIRYNVGIDHLDYISLYEGSSHGLILRQLEPGYEEWMKFFSTRHFHYSIFFASIAFFQISMTFLATRNHSYLLPYLCIILFLGGYALSWMNGIRQCMALCVFYYALNCLSEKKYIYYVLLILVATLFHKSAYMLLPVVLLGFYHREVFSNTKLCFFTYIIFFISGAFLAKPLWEHFSPYFTLFGFDDYDTPIEDAGAGAGALGSGIGRIIIFLNNLIIILFGRKMKTYFQSYFLNILYDLFYLSLLFSTIFGTIVIAGRINLYFSFLGLFIQAFLLLYMIKNMHSKYNYIFLVCFLLFKVLLFSTSIIQGEKNRTAYHYYFENTIK